MKATTSVLLLALVCSARPSFGLTRSCKWSVPTIPVFLNSSSFEARGFGAQEALQQLTNAMNVWNSEGQAAVRLVYGGDTTATSRSAGRITVWADTSAGCVIGLTVNQTGDCDGGVGVGIAIYTRLDVGCLAQPVDWTTDGPNLDQSQLGNVLVHELGHAVGL